MNEDVRKAIRISGLKQWQVAGQLGICENTLVRWLRVKLTDERREAIFAAIDSLSREGV